MQWDEANRSICGPGTFESLITLGEVITLRVDDPGATHFGRMEYGGYGVEVGVGSVG